MVQLKRKIIYSFPLDCFNLLHSFNELKIEMQNVISIDWEEEREINKWKKRREIAQCARVDDIELFTLNENKFELCISVKTEIKYMHSSNMQRVNVSLYPFVYKFLFNIANKMRFNCCCCCCRCRCCYCAYCLSLRSNIKCCVNGGAVLSAIYESHWPNMVIDRMLLIECKCKQIPAWLIFYKPHGRIAILLPVFFITLFVSFFLHLCMIASRRVHFIFA